MFFNNTSLFVKLFKSYLHLASFLPLLTILLKFLPVVAQWLSIGRSWVQASVAPSHCWALRLGPYPCVLQGHCIMTDPVH